MLVFVRRDSFVAEPPAGAALKMAFRSQHRKT